MELGRYLELAIGADLPLKMVFLAGPRQAGKTTLARHLMTGPQDLYLNWDNRQHRADLRAARWPAGEALVVLDELHKWRQWKGWLKGELDTHRERLRFLVTGSARMDVYRSQQFFLEQARRLVQKAAETFVRPSPSDGFENVPEPRERGPEDDES